MAFKGLALRIAAELSDVEGPTMPGFGPSAGRPGDLIPYRPPMPREIQHTPKPPAGLPKLK